MSELPIRDAATIILVRDAATSPKLLMGQRGASAVFMPNKYVFPGGAVDPADGLINTPYRINETCRARLGENANALCCAAIRELWEETGLRLARSGPNISLPGWDEFNAGEYVPDASAMRYIFRAITPPARPRRFDARFFLADVNAVVDDPDDFTRACDELSHLHWVRLDEARKLDLPFITEVVVAEIATILTRDGSPDTVPFFDNTTDRSLFRRIM